MNRGRCQKFKTQLLQKHNLEAHGNSQTFKRNAFVVTLFRDVKKRYVVNSYCQAYTVLGQYVASTLEFSVSVQRTHNQSYSDISTFSGFCTSVLFEFCTPVLCVCALKNMFYKIFFTHFQFLCPVFSACVLFPCSTPMFCSCIMSPIYISSVPLPVLGYMFLSVMCQCSLPHESMF